MSDLLPQHVRNATTIAIVGASGRAAAASAIRSGMTPMVADLFADLDLRRVARAWTINDYPREFAMWLAACPCDYWIYVGGLENHPRLVDQMAQSRFLLGNHGASLRRVRAPWRLAHALARRGLAFPETRCELPLLTDREWLCKALRGSGGSGVRFATDATASVRRAVMQERVEGIAASALYLFNGRESVCLALTEQLVGEEWTGARPFQYCGSLGPWAPDFQMGRQLDAIGQTLVEEFGLIGLAGVDLLVADPKIWTLEVNPRYTASVEIVERAWGTPLLAWHAAACLESRLPPAMPTAGHDCHGKAVLYAKTRLCVDDKLATMLSEAAEGGDAGPRLADLPSASTLIEPGRPVLTVFASGDSRNATRDRLQERIEEIRILLGDQLP